MTHSPDPLEEPESPLTAEVVRLIKDGWFDTTVRRLQSKHPDVADDVPDAVATSVLRFFGEDSFEAWRPDPTRVNPGWCRRHLPELWARRSAPDAAWGFDYQPVGGFPAVVRREVERELALQGHEVRRADDLHDLYLDPTAIGGHRLLRSQE